jgi:hypothetical protein
MAGCVTNSRFIRMFQSLWNKNLFVILIVLIIKQGGDYEKRVV